MEISANGEAEERVAVLEKRVRDMDALVRGLIAELLDLKTVAMALSRQEGEFLPREPMRETLAAGPSAPLSAPVSSDGSILIRPKGAGRQDAPAAPPEPVMARIMQPDGTMKMEPRYGNKKTY
jgi:hypothetical protein